MKSLLKRFKRGFTVLCAALLGLSFTVAASADSWAPPTNTGSDLEISIFGFLLLGILILMFLVTVVTLVVALVRSGKGGERNNTENTGSEQTVSDPQDQETMTER